MAVRYNNVIKRNISSLFYLKKKYYFKKFNKFLRNESIELEFLSKHICYILHFLYYLVDGNQLFLAFDDNLNSFVAFVKDSFFKLQEKRFVICNLIDNLFNRFIGLKSF